MEVNHVSQKSTRITLSLSDSVEELLSAERQSRHMKGYNAASEADLNQMLFNSMYTLWLLDYRHPQDSAPLGLKPIQELIHFTTGLLKSHQKLPSRALAWLMQLTAGSELAPVAVAGLWRVLVERAEVLLNDFLTLQREGGEITETQRAELLVMLASCVEREYFSKKTINLFTQVFTLNAQQYSPEQVVEMLDIYAYINWTTMDRSDATGGVNADLTESSEFHALRTALSGPLTQFALSQPPDAILALLNSLAMLDWHPPTLVLQCLARLQATYVHDHLDTDSTQDNNPSNPGHGGNLVYAVTAFMQLVHEPKTPFSSTHREISGANNEVDPSSDLFIKASKFYRKNLKYIYSNLPELSAEELVSLLKGSAKLAKLELEEPALGEGKEVKLTLDKLHHQLCDAMVDNLSLFDSASMSNDHITIYKYNHRHSIIYIYIYILNNMTKYKSLKPMLVQD